MENQLSMTEVDTLRRPRCPGRVKGGRTGVLIEVREIVVGRSAEQQVLIFAGEWKAAGLGHLSVRHHDQSLYLGQLVFDAFQRWYKFIVDEKYRRARVIDRIRDLFRRQPDIHRLQDSPHHWNGKVGLQESIAVPVEHADGVASADAEPGEAGREPPDAITQLAICEALHVAIYDHLVGRLHERRMP